MDLSEQVAIVTGASRGLGKAIAVALGKAGAKVACVDVSDELLAETVRRVTGDTLDAALRYFLNRFVVIITLIYGLLVWIRVCYLF